MSRIEVTGLLVMLPAFAGRTPSEIELRWWRDALAGHSAGECQAAILALSKTNRTTVTPADITGCIREARRLSEARRQRQRDPKGERQRHAAAARRGMAAVYAATGWSRREDQAAALAVPCPIPGCESPAGVICGPVNQPENRDSATCVHPSRLALARRVAETAGEVSA
jgi:hypothetical protein